jgi:hypothetical protein
MVMQEKVKETHDKRQLYKTLILLTCHESVECVDDLIDNIFKFNRDVCIVINDGFDYLNKKESTLDHVYIVKRQTERHWGSSIITTHVETWDYILEKNIQAEYVITLSSNQCFIRHNYYDFIKNYKASSRYQREFNPPFSTLEQIQCICTNGFCQEYLNDIGTEYFQSQTNHDGMFYQWDIFANMMKYFEKHRGIFINHMSDEYFYAAYLHKHVKDGLIRFSHNHHNYWSRNPEGTIALIPEIQEARELGVYLIKRIPREYNHPSRCYIRSLD